MRVSRLPGVPPGSSRFSFRWRIALGIVALVAGACPGATAGAQSVQFNGAVITPGNGNVYSGLPTGVAVDSNGNVYMGDAPGGQVWKVPLSCIEGANDSSCVTKLGGGFNDNYGVAVDSSGNVYVADGNNAVDEMPGNCTSSSCVTALGGGFVGPTGVAVDASGNVYVADEEGVKKIPAGCTAADYSANSCTLTALGGGFSDPIAVTFDRSGNLYVADRLNNAIKEMSPSCTSSSCVTTVISGVTSPGGLALDWYGNIYTTPSVENPEVVEFPAGCSSSSCEVPMGSSLSYLTGQELGGVAVDPSGTFVYVSTVYTNYPNSNSLEEIMPHGVNFFSGAAGSTGATRTLTFVFTAGGTIGTPQVLTQGATGLDFTDAGGGTCDTNGTGHSYSSGDSCTVNVTFSPRYAGVREGAVNLVNSSGAVIATTYLYGMGTAPELAFDSGNGIAALGTGFNYPYGIAVDASGNVYVADLSNNTVTETPPGCTASNCTTTLGGSFTAPAGVAVDGAGNVYVSSADAVHVMTPGCTSSSCVTTIGGGFSGPQGLAVDASGNVYVADGLNSAIKEIPAGCTSSSCVKGLGSGSELIEPGGVSVDGQGDVYVGDAPASAAYEIPLSCIQGANNSSCVKSLGSGFIEPNDVVVDPAGNAYVVDTQFSSVIEIPLSCQEGANNSSCEVQVGGGFVGPNSIALDASGNLYVTNTEAGPGLVQEIYRSGNPTTAPSLTFSGTTPVDSETPYSSQTTEMLENIGNLPLSFSAPASISANFQLDTSTDCQVLPSSPSPGTLAAGASCSLPFDFAPTTAVGTLTGSAVLTDNQLNVSNSNQIVDLTGTSTAPPPVTQLTYLAPPAGNINSGGDAGTVTVAEQTAGGVTDTVATDTITLTVTGPNSYSASYTAGASSGVATFDLSSVALTVSGTYTYTASFTGLTSAVASENVLANSVNLSSGEAVGSSTSAQAVTVVLSSSGTVSNVETLSQGTPNLDFSETGGTCGGTFTAGQICTVNVVFTPQFPGLREGAVVLEDSSDTVLGTAYIYGTGAAPELVFNSGNPIGTLGGGFGYMYGIATDSSGDVFIADTFGSSSTVKEIPVGCVTGSNDAGCVTTLGGGFSTPAGVAVDGAGNVYVADFEKRAVMEISQDCIAHANDASCVTTLGGGFSGPYGVAVDVAGNVYVADLGSSVVKEMPPGCTSSSCVTPLGGGLGGPTGVAVDASGNVYVTDIYHSAVKEIPESCIEGANDASCVITLGGGFITPQGIALDSSGNVFVADTGNSATKEIPMSCMQGANNASCVITLGSGFNEQFGVAVDPDGNVYVADTQNNLVKEINRTTPPSLSFAETNVGQASAPQTVIIGNDGSQSLSFSAIDFGADFSAEPIKVTDCSTTTAVASGAGCDLRIRFSPAPTSTTGTDTPLNEGVTLTDNSPSTTQTIPLSGTSVATPFGTMSPPEDSITHSNIVEQGDSVVVTGWAADYNDGAPIHQVAIFVDCTTNIADCTPAGNATLGIARTGVATQYGTRYLDSGWTYTYSGSLAAGSHTMIAVLSDSLGLTTQLPTHKFTVTSTLEPPFGAVTEAVDAITQSVPIGQSDGLLVTGWAADLAQGAPVSQVAIFIDCTTSYLECTPVGNATLNIPDAAVVTRTGDSSLLNSGWTYTDSSLTAGTHTVTAVAYDSGGRSTQLGSESITVQANAPPFGAMNRPLDATNRSTSIAFGDNVLVAGWAADVHDGAPVSRVAILIDGNPVGNATLHVKRTVIGTEYGSRYLFSGWTYTYTGSALSTGAHTVTAVIYDSLGLSTQLSHAFTVSP